MTFLPHWRITEPSPDFFLVIAPTGQATLCVSRKTLLALGRAFLIIALAHREPDNFYCIPGEQLDLQLAFANCDGKSSDGRATVNRNSTP